ncbi:hypothetical protein M8J77_022665 [Diaphorina citri]|nr:hypothetical protein M8J77_022665 [Diaphorina citri]
MDFSDLLSKAEQQEITARTLSYQNHRNSLPCPRRNICQTISAAEDLWKKLHKQGLRSEQGKSFLLKNAGIDWEDLVQRINRIQEAKFAFTCTEHEANVGAYLDTARELRILDEISYENKGIFAKSQQSAWKQNLQDADDEKSKLLNRFLREDNVDEILHGRHIPTNEYRSGDPIIDKAKDLTESFACSSTYEVVYFDSLLQCKEAKRKSNQEQNYVKVFHANVSKVSNILVRDMWAMAKCIEEHLDHTAERPAKFSDRNSMEWVQPSIKFLEKKYSTYMFRMTQKNEPCSIPAIVFDVTKEFTKIVLKPNLHKTSSSKFDNSFSNLVMINDDIPIWALLYYIFRSGNLKLLRGIIESDLLVLKCTSQESIGQFIRLLQEYDGQKFNSTLIQHQCQPKKISDADDPFYAILYSILSKSNVDHPGFKDIINTSEDYLWLKLHQVRFAKTPSLPKSELLTLLTPSPMAPYLNFDLFQWSIFDGHGFDRTLLSENPMLGFLYLFLSCQYEAALLYLYRTKAYRIHAVYLTIAMLKQGLIQNSNMFPKTRPSNLDKNALIDIVPLLDTSLNIASLLEDYIWDSKFFQTHPAYPDIRYDYEKCLEVFLAIQEVTVDNQSVFDQKVAEFVLKYKCYDELFGKYQINICELSHRLRTMMRNDSSSIDSCAATHALLYQFEELDIRDDPCVCGGNHRCSNKFGVYEDLDDLDVFELDVHTVAFRNGILYRILHGDEEKFKDTVRFAAIQAEECGMDYDAIQLNTVCGRLDHALKLLNSKLAFFFNQNFDSNDRKTYLKLAVTISNLLPYFAKPGESRTLIKSFHILKNCCGLYEHYVAGSYEKAMKSIEKMNVLPLDVSEVEARHEEFQMYDVSMKSAIGIILQIMTEIQERTLETLTKATSLGLIDKTEFTLLQLKRRSSAIMLFISHNESWFNHEQTNKRLLDIDLKLQ